VRSSRNRRRASERWRLDITTEQLSATRARSLSPVTDAVRDPSGAAGLGYLVALVDGPTGAILMLGHVTDPTDAGSP